MSLKSYSRESLCRVQPDYLRMNVPFLDLKRQLAPIRAEIDAAISNVLDETQFILGPEVEGFEAEFATAHNQTECVTTNNGTSSIHLALWALGVGKGDEVILPANTFIATAEAVVLSGATPVIVDHDEYYNLDPARIEEALSSRTKAILPVHLYGQPAQMEAILDIANARELLLVEDCAQAHLAKFNSKFVGSWSAASAFSFYPGKNLGAIGEGGAVNTSNAQFATQMRLTRDHGSVEKYNHVVSGTNYRLEALQAAVLRVKLPHLQSWTDGRRRAARVYLERLASIKHISLPEVHPLAEPVWHLFVIRTKRRQELQKFLLDRGIQTGLHYPVPLTHQRGLQGIARSLSCPKAEANADELLSLPMFAELTDQELGYVCESISDFFR